MAKLPIIIKPNARLTDTFAGAKSGIILNASTMARSTGIQQARLYDPVIAYDGTPGVIAKGTNLKRIENRGCARITDPVTCGGVIVGGSQNVNTESR